MTPSGRYPHWGCLPGRISWDESSPCGARNPCSHAGPSLRARVEELAALVPDLPAWPGTSPTRRRAPRSSDLIEHKQRQLIQFNVRLAGLRELTESPPARSGGGAGAAVDQPLPRARLRPARRSSSSRRTPEGGLRGYRSRAVGKGLCEAVRWSGDTLRGRYWEAALDGEPVDDRMTTATAGNAPAASPHLPARDGRMTRKADRA